MSPPKNSSLGRGLGDLMGGLPPSIGVAKPTAPMAQPPAPVELPTSAPSIAPAPIRRWELPGLLLAFTGMLVLLGTGAGIGLFAAHRLSPPASMPETGAPVRYVAVTNIVVVSAASFKRKPPESLEFLTFKPDFGRVEGVRR